MTNLPTTRFWNNAPRDQQLGIGLLALAGLVVLASFNEAISGFFVLGAMALGFLVEHRRTKLHGLAVPSGILAGIAIGVLLEGLPFFEGIAVLGIGFGFWIVQILEPRRHAWAGYVAMFFAAIAGLVFVTENAWFVALALIVSGVYVLGRRNASSARAPTAEIVAPAPPTTLERLMAWRTEVAQRDATPEAEILRTEQLERLATLQAQNVDGLFGVLDTAQIERHGKALLEVMRG